MIKRWPPARDPHLTSCFMLQYSTECEINLSHAELFDCDGEKKWTGVTNQIIDGSVPFRCAKKHHAQSQHSNTDTLPSHHNRRACAMERSISVNVLKIFDRSISACRKKAISFLLKIDSASKTVLLTLGAFENVQHAEVPMRKYTFPAG